MTNVFTNFQLYGNILVSISVMIGAITVIVQTFTKFNPLNGIRRWFNEPIHTEIIEIKNELLETQINILKSTICNASLPLSERVKAGDKYIGVYHLNGEIKSQCKILQEMYESELREKEKGGKK